MPGHDLQTGHGGECPHSKAPEEGTRGPLAGDVPTTSTPPCGVDVHTKEPGLRTSSLIPSAAPTGRRADRLGGAVHGVFRERTAAHHEQVRNIPRLQVFVDNAGRRILGKIAVVLSWSDAHFSLSPAYAEQHRPETGRGTWVPSLSQEDGEYDASRWETFGEVSSVVH